jgi:hypothetical protein
MFCWKNNYEQLIKVAVLVIGDQPHTRSQEIKEGLKKDMCATARNNSIKNTSIAF